MAQFWVYYRQIRCNQIRCKDFTAMVKRCVNPTCRVEFKLLNAGDLYAHERRTADTEFFWLCATCAESYDVFLDPAGRVSVRPRSSVKQPPHRDNDLRLISRSTKPSPRPDTMPSGERAFSFVLDVDPFSLAARARGGAGR